MSNPRKKYKGGGVAFYVKQDLKCQILTDLMIMEEKIFESIFIAIQFQNNQVVCGNTYRSFQNNNKSFLQFTNHLEKTLITINKTKSKCYLHGDFNLDLLACNNEHAVLCASTENLDGVSVSVTFLNSYRHHLRR